MKHSARMYVRGYAIAAVAFVAVLANAPEAWSRAPKAVRCQQMTEAVAKALFEEWNKTLQQNPDAVVRTYTPDAVLLPTFENGPLIGSSQIRGYFVHFLEQHPVGRIDTRAIIPANCNMGVVAGLYTFTVNEGPGRVDKPARYTYVYTYKQDLRRWLISHHHSSAQPKKAEPK
ncbi:MAG: SgcJ/EcaC family oxidoreductase [Rhizobiales bacterium]|nr:SgcJ/EcaC family oxidoreductase [Hyphomicrobiales bacterium]